jgi:hypothetical protein
MVLNQPRSAAIPVGGNSRVLTDTRFIRRDRRGYIVVQGEACLRRVPVGYVSHHEACAGTFRFQIRKSATVRRQTRADNRCELGTLSVFRACYLRSTSAT